MKRKDKSKENDILLATGGMVKFTHKEVGKLNKETELYNAVYKELSEIIGPEATMKVYLRFKGQQITFPVRLYNPCLIQKIIVHEFNGKNIAELAKKYDYSERSIRRMVSQKLEEKNII